MAARIASARAARHHRHSPLRRHACEKRCRTSPVGRRPARADHGEAFGERRRIPHHVQDARRIAHVAQGLGIVFGIQGDLEPGAAHAIVRRAHRPASFLTRYPMASNTWPEDTSSDSPRSAIVRATESIRRIDLPDMRFIRAAVSTVFSHSSSRRQAESASWMLRGRGASPKTRARRAANARAARTPSLSSADETPGPSRERILFGSTRQTSTCMSMRSSNGPPIRDWYARMAPCEHVHGCSGSP